MWSLRCECGLTLRLTQGLGGLWGTSLSVKELGRERAVKLVRWIMWGPSLPPTCESGERGILQEPTQGPLEVKLPGAYRE